MSRIESVWERRCPGSAALIPFITAGYPNPEITVPALHSLVEGGADILELGIPFSDPEADGPSIQKGSEGALKHGVTLDVVLEMVSDFRATNSKTPVVLMGYVNCILAMGYQRFVEKAVEVGVDGLIVVNLPPEEAGTLLNLSRASDLDVIFLVAPTTQDERIQVIADSASGFMYYVSIKGITGASHLDTNDVQRSIANIRLHTTLPLAVGFGIRTPDDAARIGAVADAVVVGSLMVETMATTPLEQIPGRLQALTGVFRSALNA